MADNLTLADILASGQQSRQSKPVMPEAYDMREPAGLPYMRAFGAGLVDPLPFGLTEMAAKALSEWGLLPPNTDLKARRLREMQAEAPITAGAASALIPGMGMGKLYGLTAKELLQGIGPLIGLGGSLQNVREAISDTTQPQRPQARYPTGGAY